MLFRRLRGFVIDDPAAPLRDYWVTATIAFHEPLHVEDPEPDESPYIVGYVRLMGVRCAPIDLRPVVNDAVDDGTVAWDRTEWKSIRLTDLDHTIRKRIVPIHGAGVWYQSGRILFPTWTDHDES